VSKLVNQLLLVKNILNFMGAEMRLSFQVGLLGNNVKYILVHEFIYFILAFASFTVLPLIACIKSNVDIFVLATVPIILKLDLTFILKAYGIRVVANCCISQQLQFVFQGTLLHSYLLRELYFVLLVHFVDVWYHVWVIEPIKIFDVSANYNIEGVIEDTHWSISIVCVVVEHSIFIYFNSSAAENVHKCIKCEIAAEYYEEYGGQTTNSAGY
jgi:hypothetical protein